MWFYVCTVLFVAILKTKIYKNLHARARLLVCSSPWQSSCRCWAPPLAPLCNIKKHSFFNKWRCEFLLKKQQQKQQQQRRSDKKYEMQRYSAIIIYVVCISIIIVSVFSKRTNKQTSKEKSKRQNVAAVALCVRARHLNETNATTNKSTHKKHTQKHKQTTQIQTTNKQTKY